MGAVCAIEDGLGSQPRPVRARRRQSMIRRYAELGGGQATLGDAPPARWFRDLIAAEAARDLEPLRDLFAEDFTFTDHRPMGWEPVTGREAAGELFRSGWDVAAYLHREVDEVLACDERVIALRCTLRFLNREGGGRSEVPLGLVAVIEDGVCLQQRPVRRRRHRGDARPLRRARRGTWAGARRPPARARAGRCRAGHRLAGLRRDARVLCG